MPSGAFAGVWLGGDTTDRSESPHIAGQFDGAHVLVPLLDPRAPAVVDQIRVATTLARARGAALSVVDPADVSGDGPKTFRAQAVDSDDELLEWALGRTGRSTPRSGGRFRYVHRLVRGVLDTVSAHDVDTLVLPRESSGGDVRRGVTERIAAHADCDTVTLSGRSGFEPVPSILLPVAGGPHSGLAADVAQCIAAESGAWIDVLHVVDGSSARGRERAAAYVEAAADRIAVPDRTSTWVLEADDAAEAIVEQSAYYGLTVLGAPTTGRLRRLVDPSTSESVGRNADSVVLSVRNNTDSSLGPATD